MNWGGAPSGTGTGARRSGGFAPAAGGGGAGAGAGTGAAGAGALNERAGPPAGGAAGRDEALKGERVPASVRRLRLRASWSRVVAPPWRSCWRRRRDARAGFASRAAHLGLAWAGRGCSRSALRGGSPRLATRTLSGATPAARPTSAAASAARRLPTAQTRRGRRPTGQRGWPAATLGCGAAKIERFATGAPSAAGSDGARTSKMLPRLPVELSEVRGIYVREARTLKTGPPAPGRAGKCEGTAGLVVTEASALLAAGRRVGRDARQRRVDAPPGRSGRSRSQASIGAWHCGAARSWSTSTNGIWLPGGGRPGSLGYQYRVGRLRTCRSIASAATIAASALKKKPIAPGYPSAAEGSSLECLASPASGLRSH